MYPIKSDINQKPEDWSGTQTESEDSLELAGHEDEAGQEEPVEGGGGMEDVDDEEGDVVEMCPVENLEASSTSQKRQGSGYHDSLVLYWERKFSQK